MDIGSGCGRSEASRRSVDCDTTCVASLSALFSVGVVPRDSDRAPNHDVDFCNDFDETSAFNVAADGSLGNGIEDAEELAIGPVGISVLELAGEA